MLASWAGDWKMLDREIKRQWGYLNSNLSCPLFVSNNYKMKALINKHIYFFCIIMLLLYILRRVWSSVVKCESIPSIKLTLDPQLAFDWHSLFSKDLNQHVNQYLVDTRPTLHWHSVDTWLIVWYLIEYTWSKEPSWWWSPKYTYKKVSSVHDSSVLTVNI